MKYLLSTILILPTQAFAGVSEDFERGSGGLKAEWFEIASKGLIFIVMFLLVIWVLQVSLKQLPKSSDGDGYSIFALVLRSIFLCALVILTLT